MYDLLTRRFSGSFLLFNVNAFVRIVRNDSSCPTDRPSKQPAGSIEEDKMYVCMYACIWKCGRQSMQVVHKNSQMKLYCIDLVSLSPSIYFSYILICVLNNTILNVKKIWYIEKPFNNHVFNHNHIEFYECSYQIIDVQY